MAKTKTILVLSILIALLPFLGFPQSWDNFFYVVFGLIIAGLAYLLRKNGEKTLLENSQEKQRSFLNNGQNPNTTPTQ